MNLRIGLFGDAPAYKIIFQQEGLPYENIKIRKEIFSQEFPVIVISQTLRKDEKNIIREFIKKGGGILLETKYYKVIFDSGSFSLKKTFLVPEKNSLFSNIDLIDIIDPLDITRDNKSKYIDSNLYIKKRQFEKGIIVIIPFDVHKNVLNYQAKRRKFYAKRKELPSEMVAKVAKGKIRKIILQSIEFLFHYRNLPFVQKWYYPGEYMNIFCYRIDTDFCSEKDALSLYELCKNYSIKATWFVDTSSQEKLSNVYKKMGDQEIALHCERHLIFKDYERNYENIENGAKKLEEMGIEYYGFAAPFGEWNYNLEKVLDELNFIYSSEFSIDYDDFPFFPYLGKDFSRVLQLPIHPISIGRLIRSHFKTQGMIDYYKDFIKRKIKTWEPIIIYHHPHHKKLDVIKKIFEFIIKFNIWKPTMYEFSQWWKKRNKTKLSLIFSKDKLYMEYDNKANLIYFKISMKGKGYAIIKTAKSIDLQRIKWKKQNKIEIPQDIKRIRKPHWRDLLYNYELIKTKARLRK